MALKYHRESQNKNEKQKPRTDGEVAAKEKKVKKIKKKTKEELATTNVSLSFPTGGAQAGAFAPEPAADDALPPPPGMPALPALPPPPSAAGWLPTGWEEVQDAGGAYFYNAATGESRWTRPTAQDDGALGSYAAI